MFIDHNMYSKGSPHYVIFMYLNSSSVTISVSIALASFALSTCFTLRGRGVSKAYMCTCGLILNVVCEIESCCRCSTHP